MAFGHLSSRIMGKYVSAVEDFQLEELCHSHPQCTNPARDCTSPLLWFKLSPRNAHVSYTRETGLTQPLAFAFSVI